MITQEYLKSLLWYCPKTGVFIWIKARSNRIKIGDIAGTKTTLGYLVIRIDKVNYYCHRLAWLYMTSKWPEEEFIDHKDTNKANNKWENLREATRQQNYRNTPSRSKLGIKGVSQVRNRFYATITLNRVSINLGKFSTLKEAQNAYKEAALKYHGEFAHESLK